MYRNRHITAVILARRKSSRLRDKMLLPLGGATVIETVFSRITQSKLVDNYVLAIPNTPDSDVFVPLARDRAMSVVRGSEDDVTGRISAAVRTAAPGADCIARVNCDNPLVMPEVVDDAIQELVNTGADLITPFENSTLPFGYGAVVMTRACLETIDHEAGDVLYREHVENFCFDHPEQFNIRYQQATPENWASELCLTLDTELDYLRLTRLSRLIKGTPLSEQASTLIKKILKTETAVIVQSNDAKMTLNSNTSRRFPGLRVESAPASRNAIDRAQLIIAGSALNIPPSSSAPLGVIVADTHTIGERGHFCFRYGNGDCDPHGDNIFVDDSPQAAYSDVDDFLISQLPWLLPAFMAGNVRSIDLSERRAKRAKRIVGVSP
ncbi:MAG: NTP transferase domain-containing protein [Myxococcota bacterium]|nr:NTP transferase domain-containing protein [Myxococcota bacterium]